MRHKLKKGRLNRFTSWRKATVAGTIRNLINCGRIKTTKAIAAAVRPEAEKMITLAKENTLAAKRRAYRVLCSHELVSRLFGEIGPLFKDVQGGYCRILRLGNRRGDNAEIVLLEFTRLPKGKDLPALKRPASKKQTPVIEAEKVKEEPKAQPPKKTRQHPAAEEVKPGGKKILGGIKGIFNKKDKPTP
ncbi:MAG: 50S ribosomal protein L17 [Candidatus Omnitrophota bacterium]|jgi:large subunit ribosomal protein L17